MVHRFIDHAEPLGISFFFIPYSFQPFIFCISGMRRFSEKVELCRKISVEKEEKGKRQTKKKKVRKNKRKKEEKKKRKKEKKEEGKKKRKKKGAKKKKKE